MSANNTKGVLYKFCEAFVNKRIAGIQGNIRDVRESLDSEDKNTAGDKHETGRAMLQLELENLGQQLAEAEKMEDVLDKVNIKSVHSTVGLGNLVETSKSNYFLAVSAGLYKEDDLAVYCISIGTPMGQLLLGKSVGDVVVFNGESIRITAVI
ncbi:MAG: GreA/GreB family elongation factor [Maribacter sp.]|nr:GreA/GreB family elongation factor [Maribacter sp.]